MLIVLGLMTAAYLTAPLEELGTFDGIMSFFWANIEHRCEITAAHVQLLDKKTPKTTMKMIVMTLTMNGPSMACFIYQDIAFLVLIDILLQHFLSALFKN